MAIPVKIPTRRYLRDFLAHYFENRTATFEQGGEEYLFMRNLVTKTPKESEKRDPFFDSYITLRIGDHNYRDKVLYVSNTNAWRFYLRYHKLFKEYFIQFVDSHRDQGDFKLESTIRKFSLQFGWSEDEIKHETLKKLYQRHGEKKGKKVDNIFRGTLPTVPLTVLF